jgi:hypothetical protein
MVGRCLALMGVRHCRPRAEGLSTHDLGPRIYTALGDCASTLAVLGNAGPWVSVDRHK